MNYFAIAFGAIAALTVVALDYSLHVSKAGAADAPPESYMASVQTRLGAAFAGTQDAAAPLDLAPEDSVAVRQDMARPAFAVEGADAAGTNAPKAGGAVPATSVPAPPVRDAPKRLKLSGGTCSTGTFCSTQN